MVSWSATSTNGFRPAGIVTLRGGSSELIGTHPYLGTNWVSNAVGGVTSPSIESTGTVWRVASMNVGVGTQKVVMGMSDLAGNVGVATNSVQMGVYTNMKYWYSAAGCVTNMTLRGTMGVVQTVDFAWDGLYRLTQASRNGQVVESYTYDPVGNRSVIDQGSTTNYLVYDGPHVVAETDATGGLRRVYTHGPGIDNLLAMTVYTGTTVRTYFYLTDLLGTVHAATDTNGVVVEHYRYDAWGRVLGVYNASNRLLSVSAIGNRFLWQGREYSWSTGLYYFRARWYDPVTGRFISKDPIGISGGLNEYVAFGNNPVNFTDPSGTLPTDSIGGEVVRVHKNDVDPWPSSPHGHILDKNQVIDTEGNIYNKTTRQPVGNIGKKHLGKLRTLFRKVPAGRALGVFGWIPDIVGLIETVLRADDCNRSLNDQIQKDLDNTPFLEWPLGSGDAYPNPYYRRDRSS